MTLKLLFAQSSILILTFDLDNRGPQIHIYDLYIKCSYYPSRHPQSTVSTVTPLLILTHSSTLTLNSEFCKLFGRDQPMNCRSRSRISI